LGQYVNCLILLFFVRLLEWLLFSSTWASFGNLTMLSSDVHYINLLVLATTNIVEYWFDNLQNDFFCYSFLAWLLNSISLTKTISIDWNHHCRPIYTNNIESKLVKIKIEESFSSHETLRYSILLFFLAKKQTNNNRKKKPKRFVFKAKTEILFLISIIKMANLWSHIQTVSLLYLL